MEEVLKRYYKGETTLAEERELRSAWQRGELPGEPILGLRDPMEIPEGLNEKLQRYIRQKRQRKIRQLWITAGSIAAMAVLILSFRGTFTTTPRPGIQLSDNLKKERFENALRVLGNALEDEKTPVQRVLYEDHNLIAMRRIFIILSIVSVLPFAANAQLSKLMSKYHEKNGVTVTQLDKSLYGLYQRNNLPPEANELLQKLEEVNILNLDLNQTDPSLSEKAIGQFREILDKPEKYKLIKSRNDEFGKQLIYTHNKNGQVTDLVVWNQNPQQVDIIELRGDIQLDKIALLSRALNLKGLNSLAALSSNADTYESYKHFNDFPDMNPGAISQHIRQMMENLHNHMGSGSLFGDFFGMPGDSTTTNNMPGGFPFGHFLPDEFFNPGEGMTDEDFEEFFKNGNHRQKVEKFFQSFGNGTGMSSNSVQITEENGKTKIKIDSQNSDMTYIIDGQQAPKDNVQMPDKILNVNIIPSKEDVKKSYLFITSRDRLGEFVSFQNGVLTFKYNSQEYKYNLEKMKEPLLVIDGRLADRFDIDPSEILQIRPISPIEKEVGYYPNAEVIINTK